MANEVAKEGHVWVCLACGKRSKDRYGIDSPINRGWDESCVLNSQEFPESLLIIEGPAPGRVVGLKDEVA
jgi:hypothetical protein